MATITQPQAGIQRAERVHVQSRGRARAVLTYAVLALVCLIILFPIYWMVTISFKGARDIYRVPSLVPHRVTLDNFRTLIVTKH
ncbi:MAG: hypothetical protein ACYDAR_16290, partial [Thermomicrobiales bacterium]